MTESTCKHEICTCTVAENLDHCGPTCRLGIEPAQGERCFCGHAECETTESLAAGGTPKDPGGK